MFAAGRLRHRVILQSPAGSADAYGERVTTWTDVATVWAAIDPLTLSQTLQGGQEQAGITHRITIRYSATVAACAADWRVKFGTRVLPLIGPPRNPGERNEVLELLVGEGLKTE